MRGVYSSKRNFLFDLDGTLVDSSSAHAGAFVEALTPSRATLARDFYYAPFAGRTTREVFLALGVNDESELIDLIGRKQQLYRATVERGEIQLFVGVVDLLKQLREEGGRLFLVTGASRVSAERVMEQRGLAPFFEGIATAEDVQFGKPAPDCYLHTLTVHGLKKEDCLVVEDGESGIAAARNAGLEAVLIHTDLEIPGVRNVRNCATFATLLFP